MGAEDLIDEGGSIPPAMPPGSGPRQRGSVGPLAVARTCRSCGVNVDGRPRTKNADGEYRCSPCHKRRKVLRDALAAVRRRGRRAVGVGVAMALFAMLLTGVLRSCGEPSPPPPSEG